MADENFWAEAQRQRHIALGRGAGLSDQETARERKAQQIFFPALASFQSRLRDAAALSRLMREDFRCLQNALDDHAPGQNYWDEKLAEERA